MLEKKTVKGSIVGDLFDSMAFFKPYYLRNRADIVPYLIFTVFHKGAAVITPILLKLLMDTVTRHTDFRKFTYYSLLNVAAFALFLLFLTLRYYYKEKVEAKITSQLKADLLAKILGADYREIQSREVGYFIKRISSDADNVSDLIVYDPALFFINLVYVAFVLLIMVKLSFVLFVLLLLLVPPFVYFSNRLVPRIKAVKSDIFGKEEKISSFAEEAVSGNYHIKINNLSHFFVKRYADFIKQYLLAKLKYAKADILYDVFLFTGTMNLSNLIIYIIGGYFVFMKMLTIGSLFAFSLYFSQAWGPLEFYMDFPKKLRVEILSLKRIKEMLDLADQRTGEKKIEGNIKYIEFKNVSYSANGKEILKNVNLKIKKGEKVGIIGANGSGKTTLANLLVRLIEPTEGNILINGTDYRETDINSLLEKIILIPEEPYIFGISVKENIEPEKADIKNRGLLYKTGILEIMEKSGALQGDGKNNLSGGEKKIIQFMRGIERNGEVYVLDEPLAFVDKTFRAAVKEFIRSEFSDKTLVVITHTNEFDTIFDRVYRIDKHSN